MNKPTILTFCNHYLPGYKAGGPIQSVANLVERLSAEFVFRIVTRDRDLEAQTPYKGCGRNTWMSMGPSDVLYLQPDQLKLSSIVNVLRTTPHDAIYLNSFFSGPFSVIPLIASHLGLVKPKPIVLAPRGEFSGAALTRRYWAKSLYLAVARNGLDRSRVIWQASSSFEADDIQRQFKSANVHVASDLPPLPPPAPVRSSRKAVGRAKILFLSRIHPIKNLDGAIEMLRSVPGEIEFNVFGPLEDAQYWDRCQLLAQQLPSTITMRYRGSVERSQVESVMRDHDLLLLPTRGENFGHVILEALLAGTPALISDQTPWKNLDSSGVGWDFPLSQVDAFRDAMMSIVAMDEEGRSQMAARTWQYGREFCRDEALVTQNRCLFRNALELPRQKAVLSRRVA